MTVTEIRRRRPLSREAALRTARTLGQRQEHVVARWQLSEMGFPRWLLQHELKVGRWQRAGAQTVLLHNGPVHEGSRPWIAVFEAGRRAAVDGVTSLIAAGATGLNSERIHVIAPKSSTPPAHVDGARVHESRRFDEGHVLRNGLPRTRPPVAAVHAAIWASSDRQATLFLIVAVQQRLATPRQLREALACVRRDKRRTLMGQVILQIAGGVQALGELDVAADFRSRGFPEPARQVLRQRASGREFLDAEIPELGVTFEIDGAGHDAPEQRLGDLVRDIVTAAEGKVVVRLTLLAYALDKERVLDAIEELLVSPGWQRQTAA